MCERTIPINLEVVESDDQNKADRLLERELLQCSGTFSFVERINGTNVDTSSPRIAWFNPMPF